MVSQPSRDWVVAVHSGPASPENLMTVLVAWARSRGFDPHAYSLWYESEGRALVLRGFESGTVGDFLSYARSESIPPLISGPPSLRQLSPPLPTTPAPAVPPPAPVAPPPPADSSPLLQGVLQIVTERETSTRTSENRLMEVLNTTTLMETDILWAMLLSLDGPLSPGLVALAATPSLREEGAKLFGVPPEKLPEFLHLGEPPTPADPPAAPGDEREMRMGAYRRGLAGRTAYWEAVIAKLKTPMQGMGRMTAAVVLDEAEGKVTWVFPRSSSPAIRAISSCVLYSFEGSIKNGNHYAETVTVTISFASRMARAIGMNLRWYMIHAGKVEAIPAIQGKADSQDLTLLGGLLGRYGGAPTLLAERKPPPPEPLAAPEPVPKAPLMAPSKAVPKAPKPKAPSSGTKKGRAKTRA